MGVYTTPQEPICENLNYNNIQPLRANIKQYKEIIRNINLFHCVTERIYLKCHENIIGTDSKTHSKKVLRTSKNICFLAIRTKTSPYGELVKLNQNTWRSNHKNKYKCKWLRTKIVSYVRITMTKYTGQLSDDNPIIHQDITSSICNYKEKFCRPIEEPKDIIMWIYQKIQVNVFHSLGIHNISNNYVLIPSIGIGGSIINNTPNKWLLDIGYIVEVQGIREDKILNKTSRNRFFKFSKEYVTNTKSIIQRELGQGQIYNELLLENQIISSLAAMNCRTNKQIHRLKN